MIGWIKTYTKKIAAPDPATPPLVGPDRNPSVHDFHHSPLMHFYPPDELGFISYQMPVVPAATPGQQNYNADAVRQRQVDWNRSVDGCYTKEFMRRVMRTTGLEHV